MSEIKNGGPAFPSEWFNCGDRNAAAPDGQIVPPCGTAYIQGMALRDYFAAKAMCGILAAPGVKLDGDKPKGLANLAYSVADAMLAAREAQP